MVKHIILWQLHDTLSDEEKDQIKKQIKEEMENLKGTISGLLDIHVQISCLPSSNADLMLDCLLRDEAALAYYSNHPDHLKIKDGLIAPNVKARICIDYIVEKEN